jgi:hypothetical protein
MTNPIRSLMNLVTGAKDAVGTLHEADANLRAEHERAQSERAAAITRPAPRADAVRALGAAIDAYAADWRTKHGPALLAASGGVAVEADESVRLRPARLADWLARPLALGDLAGLAPDVVKTSVAAAIAASTYDEGSALSGRLAEIATLDERLAAVEREHEQLVDHALEAGITLEHLDRDS